MSPFTEGGVWVPADVLNELNPITMRCKRCPWTIHTRRRDEAIAALDRHHREEHDLFPTGVEFAAGMRQDEIDQGYRPSDIYGKQRKLILPSAADAVPKDTPDR